ncbi:electron transfer flavoprotein subunit alpha/FixB family protein [Salinivirga cyanobacteriivorans]
MSILAYTPIRDGQFTKLTYELLSYGRALADQLSTELVALSLGKTEEDQLKTLAEYGADKILHSNDDRFEQLDNRAFSKAISQAAEKNEATIVLMANDFTGKALAPATGVHLKAGVVSGVIGLPESTDPFVVKKKVFTGKAFARIQVKGERKIFTLETNSYEITQTSKEAAIETFEPQLDEGDFTTKIIEEDKQTDKILLTDADIVVSGGRGMKGPEHWQPLEELAEVLGAATACSRPVSDEKWRPEEEHVGQTGKIIAPNLYFALGISGAIQHVAGVSGSKTIVAVNNDPEAPIFEVANYGIVGDLKEVLPNLIEAAKAAK